MKLLMAGALLILAACSSAPLESPSGDGAFTLSVPPSPGTSAQDRRLSLECRKADFKHVVDMIARTTGMSIILNSDLGGAVSMSVTDVTAVDALDAVARSVNYKVVVVRDNLVRILRQ